MKALRIIPGIFALLFALMITAFIFADTLQYWDFEPNIGFLRLKQAAVRSVGWLYLPAFYAHIALAPIVAFLGLFQFWGWLRRKVPAWHRLAGRIYVLGILFVAAPGGFVMAWFADGGLAGLLCFLCLAIAWWGCTWLAWRTILRGDVAAHRRWMARSYALTSAAILLRFFIALAINLGASRTPELYALIAWGSWVLPLLAVLVVQGVWGRFNRLDDAVG